MLCQSSSLVVALAAIASLGVCVSQSAAQGPTGQARYTAGTTGMNNPAMRYSRPAPAAVAPTPFAPPQALPPAPTAPRRSGRIEKPFADTVLQPTVSPYLALGLPENNAGMPNYHLFVRPQLDQQRQFQTQQMQQQKMQQQIRAASRPPSPTTGGVGRFQNYSGYYPMR